ncbi:hypothetical protein MRX96_009209 [Rhipicephalus microplus]|uniref:uncharacterized protein LOC119160932 n=1 Tax=Rhipicephalus microplus TaxID=6941 RepID=UPI001889212F|nr:uncharacterized protein LOC119160932 [Rhipicephalus microplus]
MDSGHRFDKTLYVLLGVRNRGVPVVRLKRLEDERFQATRQEAPTNMQDQPPLKGEPKDEPSLQVKEGPGPQEIAALEEKRGKRARGKRASTQQPAESLLPLKEEGEPEPKKRRLY